MAYNFIVEFGPEVNWEEAHTALSFKAKGIESFPVTVGQSSQPKAVGVSVNQFPLHENGIAELMSRFASILRDGRGSVFNLYSGGELKAPVERAMFRDLL